MSELIGYAAGILGIIAWLPQMKRVWIEHKHEGISLPTFTIVAIALSLWVAYGVIQDGQAIIVSNIAALGMIVCIIIGVMRLRARESFNL